LSFVLASPEIFSDGFETNDFSAWTGTTTTGDATETVVSSQQHHGTYSAESYTVAGTKAYCYKTFTGQTTIFVRRYFRLNEAFTATYATMTLDVLRGGGSDILHTGIRYTGSGQYQFYAVCYYPTESSDYANIDLTVGDWHCIEYKFVKHASSGEYRFYWDGSELASLTETSLDTSGASDADEIYVGVRYNNVGEEHTIHSDCVIVDTSYIGLEAAGATYIVDLSLTNTVSLTKDIQASFKPELSLPISTSLTVDKEWTLATELDWTTTITLLLDVFHSINVQLSLAITTGLSILQEWQTSLELTLPIGITLTVPWYTPPAPPPTPEELSVYAVMAVAIVALVIALTSGKE